MRQNKAMKVTFEEMVIKISAYSDMNVDLKFLFINPLTRDTH